MSAAEDSLTRLLKSDCMQLPVAGSVVEVGKGGCAVGSWGCPLPGVTAWVGECTVGLWPFFWESHCSWEGLGVLLPLAEA